MGVGESSWSHWTRTSAVEGKVEIEIFDNKIFLKKEGERGCSPQARLPAASGLTWPAGGQTQPAGG